MIPTTVNYPTRCDERFRTTERTVDVLSRQIRVGICRAKRITLCISRGLYYDGRDSCAKSREVESALEARWRQGLRAVDTTTVEPSPTISARTI